MKQILVTGGAGFIGSHTLVELHNAGYSFVVADNFVNSDIDSIRRVEKIIGERVIVAETDLSDRGAMEQLFERYRFDACIHFAGLKSVGESLEKPLEYYRNNLGGTFVLVEMLAKYNCRNLIFSSSANVYGNPDRMPVSEDFPRGETTNPYGRTKAMLEQILGDIQKSDTRWNIVMLRYFNPIGAHTSGVIGEVPQGVPSNLMPYITEVAMGKRPYLNVYGNDYNTPDGTGVRDYIHIMDLARGHIAALSALERNCGLKIYNLGTGRGYSVLEVVNAFEKVNGVKVPYKIMPRREGDIAISYCNPGKAKEELGWSAEFGLEQMCRDAWRWQTEMEKMKIQQL